MPLIRFNNVLYTHCSILSLSRSFGKALASEIGMDDSKAENISTQCRPSVLRETFVKLSSQDASNIKSSIPIQCDEMDKEFKNLYIDQLFCALYMVSHLNQFTVKLPYCNFAMRIFNKKKTISHCLLDNTIIILL